MDDLEFPEKYYRLKEVKSRMLGECNLCNHIGYVDGKSCKCLKKFEKYVDYAYCGIDEEYWNIDFDDFQSDQVAKEEAKKYCDNLENARKHGLGFVFHGDNGTGKSTLSCIILIQAKKQKHSIYFATFSEVLSIIKKSFASSYWKEYYDKMILNADFLCIDELGSEYRPKDLESFCVAELNSLSRYRRRHNLCTLITTNLDQNDFITTYGKTISSLFSGCSKFVAVKGGDWRIK